MAANYMIIYACNRLGDNFTVCVMCWSGFSGILRDITIRRLLGTYFQLSELYHLPGKRVCLILLDVQSRLVVLLYIALFQGPKRQRKRKGLVSAIQPCA